MFYANLDIIFFVYGLAFISMGIAVLAQPKITSEFEIANIFWLLAAFGIIHGLNEFLDMWAIIKGRHPVFDTVRFFVFITSYIALFEFGRRLFRLKIPSTSGLRKKLSGPLQWWLLPVIVAIIFVASLLSSDFWKTGNILSRYMLGLPGGVLIGFGFNSYYYAEKEMLEPLNVKKYFFFAGVAFVMYGIFGGLIVPEGNFVPSSVVNSNSFLAALKVPVQAVRAICAVIATWAMLGMIKIFNWEISTKLQKAQDVLKKQLRLYEERFMEVVESSSDIIYSIDTHGVILSTNKQGYQILDYLHSDIIGKHIKEICTRETWEELAKGFEKVKAEGSVFLDAGKIIRRTGENLDVTAHSTAMYDERKEFHGVRLTFRDITEHKKMEEELRNIEKLESIGIMAGGIAHDFNNILTTITGNISLARVSAKNDRKLSRVLSETQKACNHARNLTNQLLTFSKGGAPIKKVQYIKNLLKDSTKFALRGSPVNYELFLEDDLWPVEVDEGQIIQVIHNLALNAQQAMCNGGTIAISAENVAVEKADPLPFKGNYIKIRVKDEGIGIPAERMNKIFDPYFTTKEEGSGLGLTTTFSIIKNHDGHIFVDSRENVGTTFSIFLPASDERAYEEKKKMDKDLQGAGYILIMDDEENVRRSVCRMLRYLGYDVEAAKNGEQAIDLYKNAMESVRPFDAVLMDLTIRGGKGGKETIKELRRIDSQVKAVVSSGYFNDPIMADYNKHGFFGVIPKPYEIEVLNEVLQKVTNGKN
jgi:PAS domain S-box-containing protein